MKKVIIKVIQNGDGIEETLELIFNNHELSTGQKIKSRAPKSIETVTR
ncbi:MULTISPECIES: hypothetical protein [Pseudanabaena]|uniref:Uncharacterized protein n=2 Tax=Pseudanabaena TaxID=1152 RepID=L8N5W5_9CYAN|nr:MULTISPECIES: hypothetical protein [Pseudanabaena]ELS34524.1 hypothetical protein Pse7429DRAFT_0280 [Pseudanabaena biceps PCC 7429]MDG3493295.1 hypothetical protein [Pseudanabaena catenata USMAC16]